MIDEQGNNIRDDFIFFALDLDNLTDNTRGHCNRGSRRPGGPSLKRRAE
jgi:hypothetical protein